jgi:hypothetical protein
MQVLDSHEKTGRSKVTPTTAKADPLYLVDLQAQSRPSHAYDDDVSVSKSLSATAPMKNLNRDLAPPNTRNTTADKLAACFTMTYPASASASVSLTHGSRSPRPRCVPGHGSFLVGQPNRRPSYKSNISNSNNRST